MKEKQSTLDPFLIKVGRGVGNTSRQVDLAIQLLFDGNIIVVQDHWEEGQHRDANKELFRRVFMRLKDEFNIGLTNDIMSGRPWLVIRPNKSEMELCR